MSVLHVGVVYHVSRGSNMFVLHVGAVYHFLVVLGWILHIWRGSNMFVLHVGVVYHVSRGCRLSATYNGRWPVGFVTCLSYTSVWCNLFLMFLVVVGWV